MHSRGDDKVNRDFVQCLSEDIGLKLFKKKKKRTHVHFIGMSQSAVEVSGEKCNGCSLRVYVTGNEAKSDNVDSSDITKAQKNVRMQIGGVKKK